MPLKLCAEPACPNLIPAGRENRCADHKRDTRSPSSRVTGTRRWRKLRDQVLARDRYRCLICASRDRVQVHHVEAVGLGGERLPPPSKLVSLCHQHHGQAHRAIFTTKVGIDPQTLPTDAVAGLVAGARLPGSMGISGSGGRS